MNICLENLVLLLLMQTDSLTFSQPVMSLLSSVCLSLILTIFYKTNQQFLITKCWNIRLVFPCHIISNFELMYDNTELSKTVKIWRNSHQHSPTQQQQYDVVRQSEQGWAGTHAWLVQRLINTTLTNDNSNITTVYICINLWNNVELSSQLQLIVLCVLNVYTIAELTITK